MTSDWWNFSLAAEYAITACVSIPPLELLPRREAIYHLLLVLFCYVSDAENEESSPEILTCTPSFDDFK
jgi:hypothetical protein